MQELNEGNVFNMETTASAGRDSSKEGLRVFKSELKSQLMDYFKRNKVQNADEIIKKTFGELLEDIEIGDFEVSDGGIFPAIEVGNQTGAEAVVVTNPKGRAFKSPEGSLGMGFAVSPTLLPELQKFVSRYQSPMQNQSKEGIKYELERMAETDEPEELTNITWQKMNSAVSNYISQQLKQKLQQFGAYLPDKSYETGNNTSGGEHYDPYNRNFYRIGKQKISNNK